MARRPKSSSLIAQAVSNEAKNLMMVQIWAVLEMEQLLMTTNVDVNNLKLQKDQVMKSNTAIKQGK